MIPTLCEVITHRRETGVSDTANSIAASQFENCPSLGCCFRAQLPRVFIVITLSIYVIFKAAYTKNNLMAINLILVFMIIVSLTYSVKNVSHLLCARYYCRPRESGDVKTKRSLQSWSFYFI